MILLTAHGTSEDSPRRKLTVTDLEYYNAGFNGLATGHTVRRHRNMPDITIANLNKSATPDCNDALRSRSTS